MRNERKIKLTATQAKISYSGIVAALTEKIINGGELIPCDNLADIKKALDAAENKNKKG